jgi:hypothetical protein
MDELTEDVLLVLCARGQQGDDDSKNTIYIWKGEEFEQQNSSSGNGGEITVQQFIDKVKAQYWGKELKSANIEVVEEEVGEESDDFLNYFD